MKRTKIVKMDEDLYDALMLHFARPGETFNQMAARRLLIDVARTDDIALTDIGKAIVFGIEGC